MILGIVLIILSAIIISLNVLNRYLSAEFYDPLGLGPTAMRADKCGMPDIKWIAIPDDFEYELKQWSTGNRVVDILDSADGHLVGRGKTARKAVQDMINRHLKDAEEIDLTC